MSTFNYLHELDQGSQLFLKFYCPKPYSNIATIGKIYEHALELITHEKKNDSIITERHEVFLPNYTANYFFINEKRKNDKNQ